MKKVALTSLFAVLAVTTVKANVIDGNPLYKPAEGHFYSVTSVGSDTKYSNTWGLGEEFGYGLSDRLTLRMFTDMYETRTFKENGWSDFKIGLDYRVLDHGNWKADVWGAYSLNPVWGDHEEFLDKDLTTYMWEAGVRAGYTYCNFTLAGYAAFDYYTGNTYDGMSSKSFNLDDEGLHTVRLGIDGQYVINSSWNIVGGVEYEGVLDDDYYGWEVENAGTWTGTLGVNYNIDETKFVGVYANEDLDHHDGWTSEKGFGFGAKFGIDF